MAKSGPRRQAASTKGSSGKKVDNAASRGAAKPKGAAKAQPSGSQRAGKRSPTRAVRRDAAPAQDETAEDSGRSGPVNTDEPGSGGTHLPQRPNSSPNMTPGTRP